jgi:peptidoglycan hydrolase CwlO-like protein
MISDEVAKRLHDKATRGISLSAEEQSQLENWYLLQDSFENENYDLPKEDKNLISLQNQIDKAVAQLTTISKRIQKITSENHSLKQEIGILHNKLARLPTEKLA